MLIFSVFLLGFIGFSSGAIIGARGNGEEIRVDWEWVEEIGGRRGDESGLEWGVDRSM